MAKNGVSCMSGEMSGYCKKNERKDKPVEARIAIC